MHGYDIIRSWDDGPGDGLVIGAVGVPFNVLAQVATGQGRSYPSVIAYGGSTSSYRPDGAARVPDCQSFDNEQDARAWAETVALEVWGEVAR